MKAITIHQPWASLIALGEKRYETRGWRTHYRGPIARIWREISPLPKGCTVAVAELVDCWKKRVRFIETHELIFGDYTPGRYAWEMANVRLIDPVPAKGQKGLWNWEDMVSCRR